MAKDEKSICPLCGASVNAKATECMKCGAKFEENNYACGNCGSALKEGEKVCKICGMDYGDKTFACPICDARVSREAIMCPHCGAEFADETYRCAFCGAKVNENTMNCPKCSAVLIKEEERKKEIPKPGEEGKEGDAPKEGEEAKAEEEKKKEDEGKEKQKVKRLLFPFVAVVGQDLMKRALMLNAINPDIGGVLLRGQRGTAKSVTVRGLAEILPPIEVVKECRFACNPKDENRMCWECRERLKQGPLPTETRNIRIVDLPLNATEDRVVGSIDIDKILSAGLKAFEPGILAEANRGLLYVDEINLLDDFLVDVLLDAAAMGVCTVEREGVSVSYPAKFIIIGSMNPEEGDLRPQLLDRIALLANIVAVEDLELRKEIVRANRDFSKDMITFRKKFEPMTTRLRQRITKARELLPSVKVPDIFIDAFGKASIEFKLDGHRADLMMERTSKTNAAYEGRSEVNFEDIMIAGQLIIPHRMKKDVFAAEEFSKERLEGVFRSAIGEEVKW